MKQKVLKLMCLLCVGMISMSAWADVTYTYLFTSKSWAASLDGDGTSTNNWTSGQAGNALTQGQGLQVTTGTSGANGTSPRSFSNVSTVVVGYCTNASKGAGSISVKVGETTYTTSGSVSTSGGTTVRYLTFTTPTPATGNVKITVTCSTNSVYIYNVAITETAGASQETTSTAIDASEITNTDLKGGTAAGTLTASVKDESDAAVAGATVTWSSNNTAVATVGETTGVVTLVSEGSATITATYAGNEDYAGSNDTYNLVVTDTRYTTVWSEDFSGYDAVPTAGTNATYTNSGAKFYDSDPYAGGIAPELLINGNFTVSVTELKGCLKHMVLTFKTNNTNITPTITSNGSTLYNTKVSAKGEQRIEFELPDNPQDLTIAFSSTSNSRLDDIVLKGLVNEVTYERDVTAGNYGTICLNSPASATGATFYTIAGKDAATPSYITITEADADNLEAGVGYIFKATGSKIVATYKDFAVAEAEDAVNGLQGTLVAKADMTAAGVADGNLYMIKNNKVKAATLETSLAANRAYIDMSEVPVAAGVKGVRLGFDEATGITELTESTEKTEGTEGIYNLNGQRVNSLLKGINIVGGKKVLVK